jgi:hypothetical protein
MIRMMTSQVVLGLGLKMMTESPENKLQKRRQTTPMIFRKKETPKKGHPHFCTDSCDSPVFGKTFFLKTRNPKKGTSALLHQVPKMQKPFS